eukprot:GHVU01117292.1.p2 GENE.GHVU01117292.1~~GHVU01117292.1.p2  ORF type:complete len:101 (-),score=7.50 GHVU01117292.1:1296-1598(-)
MRHSSSRPHPCRARDRGVMSIKQTNNQDSVPFPEATHAATRRLMTATRAAADCDAAGLLEPEPFPFAEAGREGGRGGVRRWLAFRASTSTSQVSGPKNPG